MQEVKYLECGMRTRTRFAIHGLITCKWTIDILTGSSNSGGNLVCDIIFFSAILNCSSRSPRRARNHSNERLKPSPISNLYPGPCPYVSCRSLPARRRPGAGAPGAAAAVRNRDPRDQLGVGYDPYHSVACRIGTSTEFPAPAGYRPTRSHLDSGTLGHCYIALFLAIYHLGYVAPANLLHTHTHTQRALIPTSEKAGILRRGYYLVEKLSNIQLEFKLVRVLGSAQVSRLNPSNRRRRS